VGIAPLRAQDTNVFSIVPATKLEAITTNVSTIIIKGTTDLGGFAAKTATISVKCKDYSDPASGHREQGISIEIVRNDQPKDVMLVDYDELAPLINAIDYLSKLDVSVSPMETFDAAYTTKGGFRLAALGTRRTGQVQFGMRDIRYNSAPVVMTREEMTRLDSLIDQAKRQLDAH
jgi:hypothetical protein